MEQTSKSAKLLGKNFELALALRSSALTRLVAVASGLAGARPSAPNVALAVAYGLVPRPTAPKPYRINQIGIMF